MNIQKLLLTGAFCAGLFPALAHAGDFERTLPASAALDLYVSTGAGRIHVYPGTDSEIHVKAHVYAGWNAGGDIDSRIRRISENPPIEQSGNEVHIGDVRPEDRRIYNNITIDYEISAPKSSALNLRSGSGDVLVDNLGRFLKGQTGSGNLRAHGIGGPSELQTGSGDIELEVDAPGEVRTSTGSGNIRVHGLNGALTARTGSGDIEADGSVTGSSRLQTGSGNIRLHVGPEAHFNVDASSGSGDIRIAGAPKSEHHHISAPVNGGGPSLEAHTGSGDIEVN
jgi:DUF4097 and DUF4098 domain-containing protein YvlB